MSYETLEQSVRSGSPVECYRFICGDDVWRYTSHDREVYHEWRQAWADEGCTGTDASACPYLTLRYGHASGYVYSTGWYGHRGVRPSVAYVDAYGLSAFSVEGGAAGARIDTVLCVDDYYAAGKAGVAWGFSPLAMAANPTTTPYYACGVYGKETRPYIGVFHILDQTATLIAEAQITAYLTRHYTRYSHLPVSVRVRGNDVEVWTDDHRLISVTDDTIAWSSALTGIGLFCQGSGNFGYSTTPYMDTSVEDYFRVYARDFDGSEEADAPAPNHYTPEAIFRGEVEQNQEDQTGSITITLPAKNPVALLFRDFLPAAPVQAVVFRNQAGDLGAGIVHFSGTVSAVEFKGSEAVLTCLPLSEAFRRPIPWQMFQSQCGHPLYSTACGVDRATYALAATITEVNATGSIVKATEFATKADRWFRSGWMEAGGEVRWIVGHTGDTITLSAPFSALAVGASVTVYPGCDRTETVCENKFSNLANFSGWSHIPAKNPFNSSLT